MPDAGRERTIFGRELERVTSFARPSAVSTFHVPTSAESSCEFNHLQTLNKMDRNYVLKKGNYDIKIKYVAVPMKHWGLLIAEFLKVRYMLKYCSGTVRKI